MKQYCCCCGKTSSTLMLQASFDNNDVICSDCLEAEDNFAVCCKCNLWDTFEDGEIINENYYCEKCAQLIKEELENSDEYTIRRF